MMIIVGDGLLGHGNGKYFMLAEAFTVFLALIGTTLSCMNTVLALPMLWARTTKLLNTSAFFMTSRSLRVAPSGRLPDLAVIGVVAVSLAFGDAVRRLMLRLQLCLTASFRASATAHMTRWPLCPTHC